MVMSATTAKTVREALQAAGFGRKDISVRNDSYSMGSTVYVRIRRADIALDAVEAIASAHERVSRDEGTGEILSGGNTFVTVEYGHGALDAATVTIREMLDAGVYEFGALSLTIDHDDPDRLDVWAERIHVCRISREYGAEQLTRKLASRGELAAVLAGEAGLAQANDVAAELASEPELAPEAAPALASAPEASPAPEAAPAPASASAALVLARKALIAAHLRDLAEQLEGFEGTSWAHAGTLAAVVRALDEMPAFGRDR
jgi:hypothetical protein